MPPRPRRSGGPAGNARAWTRSWTSHRPSATRTQARRSEAGTRHSRAIHCHSAISNRRTSTNIGGRSSPTGPWPTSAYRPGIRGHRPGGDLPDRDAVLTRHAIEEEGHATLRSSRSGRPPRGWAVDHRGGCRPARRRTRRIQRQDLVQHHAQVARQGRSPMAASAIGQATQVEIRSGAVVVAPTVAARNPWMAPRGVPRPNSSGGKIRGVGGVDRPGRWRRGPRAPEHPSGPARAPHRPPTPRSRSPAKKRCPTAFAVTWRRDS